MPDQVGHDGVNGRSWLREHSVMSALYREHSVMSALHRKHSVMSALHRKPLSLSI